MSCISLLVFGGADRNQCLANFKAAEVFRVRPGVLYGSKICRQFIADRAAKKLPQLVETIQCSHRYIFTILSSWSSKSAALGEDILEKKPPANKPGCWVRDWARSSETRLADSLPEGLFFGILVAATTPLLRGTQFFGKCLFWSDRTVGKQAMVFDVATAAEAAGRTEFSVRSPLTTIGENFKVRSHCLG